MKTLRVVLLAAALVISISSPLFADETPLLSWLSTSVSFTIAPYNNWGSGDFNAVTDEWFGDVTPRVNKLDITLEQSASTTYEGDLFFSKLRLAIGLNIDVDDNIIGKINRIMGYIGYSGFTLRFQKSDLKGTVNWSGETVDAMPMQSDFDNPFINVDLLYYTKKGNIDYYGIGYTSYNLPVQLDLLTYDPVRQSVWWNYSPSAAYQPDMEFHIYSILLGIDTLHQSMAGTGLLGRKQGFGLWMATQDRAGAGVSYIGEDEKTWLETASGKTIWSEKSITMMVDYNLILEIQYVKNISRLRLGLGAGFEIGGQLIESITPKGPVDDPSYIDATPSLYLYHYGPVFRGSVSF